MTEREYRQPLRVLATRRWRLVEDVQNGYVRVPAGTIVRVTGKFGGLDIEGERCETCGVQPRCSRVNAWLLEDEGPILAPPTPAWS